ncbi:MAG: class I SAM-dependent methyltransferase [Anaerovoracaceae bacterium]|nr:class I SAM-dependent methyltransferase [Bacillota bacterium]MDY5906651.1 class I SAM-dependent methyltransferase [Anaerovoracaceae bacterium]
MNKENTENVNRSNEPEKAAAGPLTVIYTDTVYEKEAEALAEHTGAGKAQYTENAPAHDQGAGLMLLLDDSGLSLTDGKISLQADLTSMLPRLKKNNLERELLVKASRIKGMNAADGQLRAVDATAGFGEDSLLLAAAGYNVELYEYDPVIAALLRDALRRAAKSSDDALRDAVSRMDLREGDSVSAMRAMAGSNEPPDIVLLDPMFPERRKSALVKKKFQLLQQLESPCEGADEGELLEAAEAAGPRRIIIKRPLKGPYLAGRRPGYSITGKAVRYDCIVIPR